MEIVGGDGHESVVERRDQQLPDADPLKSRRLPTVQKPCLPHVVVATEAETCRRRTADIILTIFKSEASRCMLSTYTVLSTSFLQETYCHDINYLMEKELSSDIAGGIAEALRVGASVMIRHLARGTSLTSRNVLAALAVEGPSRLTALATATGIAQPAMTQLVGRLERAGLVVQLIDPRRRARHAGGYHPTPDGHCGMSCTSRRTSARPNCSRGYLQMTRQRWRWRCALLCRFWRS